MNDMPLEVKVKFIIIGLFFCYLFYLLIHSIISYIVTPCRKCRYKNREHPSGFCQKYIEEQGILKKIICTYFESKK